MGNVIAGKTHSDNKACQECGKLLTGQQRKYCSIKCGVLYNQRQRYQNDAEFRKEAASRSKISRRIYRLRALRRLAALKLGRDIEGEPVCAHCGCPHIMALDIGHCNDDGAEHREELGGNIAVIMWIIKASDKEIMDKNIRIECCYCNTIKSRIGRYPLGYQLPQWWLTSKGEY